MELRNCKSCGRMIQYPGFGLQLCGQCSKNLDMKFRDVKDYLKENPRTSINELSEAVDVTVSQINQWIREERLVFANDSPIGIDCESCGKMIKSGRYCPECKNRMINQLGGGKKQQNEAMNRKKIEDAKARMRFLDR